MRHKHHYRVSLCEGMVVFFKDKESKHRYIESEYRATATQLTRVHDLGYKDYSKAKLDLDKARVFHYHQWQEKHGEDPEFSGITHVRGKPSWQTKS